MMRFSLGLGVVLLAMACGSKSSDASDDPTGDRSATSTETCNCSVSINGEEKSFACGKSACVDGQSYTCGQDASLERKGTACDTPESPSTSATPSATATTFACPGATASNEVCVTATQYCLTSKSGGAFCAPLPKDCHDCDCAGDNADAAWKALANGTSNCGYSTFGQAVVSCHQSNATISVSCSN